MSTRPTTGPGIHHIALNVSDFDRSLAFYTEGLGLKRAFGWGEGANRAALLDTGDGNYVEILGGRKPLNDAEAAAVASFTHFALRVADTDAAFARAMAAGARVKAAPADVSIPGDHPLKVRIAFLYGPDGEVFEFFHNEEL